MELKMEDLDFRVSEITNKDFIASFIASNCLERPETPYMGKLPGTRYQSQYYLTSALLNPEFMEKVSEEFVTLIIKNIGHFNFQICGREWSASPLLSALPIFMKMERIEINSFMIRREMKSYGKNNWIEGTPNDLPVLVVDDICNSTNSFAHCHNILKYEGLTPIPFIFSVLNKYRRMDSPKAFKEDRYLKDVMPISIVTGDDIDNAIRRTET